MNKKLPFWEQKVWGEVLHCFHNPHTAVSFLRVKAGFQCSRHHHEERANVFTVISGVIKIEHWYPAMNTRYEIILGPGQSYTVPSKDVHRFSVLEDGEVIEVYYPDTGGNVHPNDIVRLDTGGRIG